MLYKDFKGLSLSALGIGTMRLPTIDGDNAKIDEEKSAEMFDYAISKGVNYFDTAWGYHSGQSEPTVGKLLSKYPREKFYLASKFPGYDVANLERVEEIFEKQLERCRVDYFDFYLVHTVTESNIDAYLDEKYGLYKFLTEQKKNGRIKHLGFSVHGSYETTERFLAGYGDAMEFCQVQLNWIDYDYQKAKDKMELLAKWDIPVWVMEPLRGGKLASLEEKHEKLLYDLRPGETVPAWSFRYLQAFDQVKVVLSGMSNFEQLAQNIETFEENKPVTAEEAEVLYSIAREMLNSVPCTECRYCVEKCPMGLEIPELIKLYNKLCFSGGYYVSKAIAEMPEEKRPTECISCRACERVCPQMIKISEVFSDFSKKTKKD